MDTHAHVVSSTRPIQSNRHSQPEHDATASELIALFDAHGISHGLLTAPSVYGTDNSLALDAVAASAGRLRATVGIGTETTLTELERLRGAGAVGARLNWFKKQSVPDVRAWQPVLERVREAGMHVELFVESWKLQDILPSIAATGVAIVLDHFGLPDADKGIDGPGFRLVRNAVEQGSTWVKLSAPYRMGNADPQPFVDALLASGGVERLMWGSDWPWSQHADGMSYSRCVDWIETWIPDAELRRVVLWDTPARLFGFATFA
jgi:predicted TIM-barrel fold metal-dependent hydrolase